MTIREINKLRSQKNSEEEYLFCHEGTTYQVFNEFELNNNQYALMGEHNNFLGDELLLFQMQDNQAIDIADENEWVQIVEAIEHYSIKNT